VANSIAIFINADLSGSAAVIFYFVKTVFNFSVFVTTFSIVEARRFTASYCFRRPNAVRQSRHTKANFKLSAKEEVSSLFKSKLGSAKIKFSKSSFLSGTAVAPLPVNSLPKWRHES